MWAASGSEAITKALWAALARDRSRDMIIATRHGFHGKKGLAGAVTWIPSSVFPRPAALAVFRADGMQNERSWAEAKIQAALTDL